MTFARPALVFLAALSLALPARAQDDPEASPLVAACDALAAHPANADNPPGVAGIGWAAFDATAALAACETAFAAFPDHLRTAFQLARAHHKLGDFATAERFYQQAAAQGYPRAEAGLMVLYFETPALGGAQKGVPFGEACALQGDLICQTELARVYRSGLNGLPRDYAEAMKYQRLAAAQGDLDSQYFLALALEKGQGVEPDPAAALVFYEQAASRGDVPSQFRLGLLYSDGDVVAQDYEAASKWFTLAAGEGSYHPYLERAQYKLGLLYFDGLGVAQDRTRALALFEASAAQDYSPAASYAGWMYDEGVGVAEDDARAVSYYLPAAGAGDFFAQNNLAVHYEKGTGVTQDDGLALYWYEKAAAQGDAEDQYIVGGYYLDGIGTEKDFYKAAEWFRRAAAQGSAPAAAELEQMIADGLVVPGPTE